MTNTGDATATAHEAPTDETTAEETGRNANRSTTPGSEGFKSFIGGGWAERDERLPEARPQAAHAAVRSATVSA
ncbi:aminopeptidase P family protein, partial [Agromyces binzhouensis]